MVIKTTTYVFDFYNLYLPQEKSYVNKKEGVRIAPLKLAEEFEKKRTKFGEPYQKRGWKTAKCYITKEKEKDAKELAVWIEFLFSFAQNRSVFFLDWYEYNKGKKYNSFESKFVEPRHNRHSPLISGTLTKGPFFTRDISLFIDTAISTLRQASDTERENMLRTVHTHLIAKSEKMSPISFLINWISLESLANEHYNRFYKSQGEIFSQKEVQNIKSSIKKLLDRILRDHKHLFFLKKSISRNFIYELGTYEKVVEYLYTLDLGFHKSKLKKVLRELTEIRSKFVHDMNDKKLMKKTYLRPLLEKIMERVILRLLGIDLDTQKILLLNQYNRGNYL